MMVPFSNKAWGLFKQNPDIGFNELSLVLKDEHGEPLMLAQFLLLLGMKQYAAAHNVPLEKVSGVMYARADSVKGFTANVSTDPIVMPCGGCGGGELR